MQQKYKIDSKGHEFRFTRNLDFFSGLVTDFSFQVLVFIVVHTVYTGNMLSQKPQEGKKGQQWEKREPVKVLKTLNDRQSYILSKLHKIETFQLILTIICRKVKRS